MQICSPALIYLLFSLTQILIDTVKGLYNTAFMKIIVMVLITYLLNIMCERGLGVVSWIIVFIPFIFMTVIVGMLLYIFGLDAATGKLNYQQTPSNVSVDANGNIIVYDPNYNPTANPVRFNSPNIIIPKPTNDFSQLPSYTSSDPSYQN